MESIRSNIHLFEPVHFIFPFLAHALGTLVGAFVVAKLVTNRKMTFAIAIGIWSLLGGLAAAYLIPAPNWFIVLDLLVAYIPIGWQVNGQQKPELRSWACECFDRLQIRSLTLRTEHEHLWPTRNNRKQRIQEKMARPL